MKFFIDTANVDDIRKANDMGVICGVTTNPSILAKSGRNPYDVLGEIRGIIGPDAELHVQVISKDAEGMIKEAQVIREKLGEKTYIKIPTTREGLKAMKALKKNGINVTATAIYTAQQAFLAGKAGADYAAPYINRIDNLGANGIATAKKIHDIFRLNNLPTSVLAASFKNSQQVLELAEYGVGAATVSADVIEGLLKNEVVSSAVDAFIADFEGLVGEGMTMADC